MNKYIITHLAMQLGINTILILLYLICVIVWFHFNKTKEYLYKESLYEFTSEKPLPITVVILFFTVNCVYSIFWLTKLYVYLLNNIFYVE